MSDLFTVLIAEKEHIDAIQRKNKLFFEPFLKNKEMAFCEWNPAGQNLYDSVPGLADAVRRKKQWRAVIINSCSPELQKTQNPFDAVDYSSIAALSVPETYMDSKTTWEDWKKKWEEYYDLLFKKKDIIYRNSLKLPLQRLTTWLCFKPEDFILCDVKVKQDVYDLAVEELSAEVIKPSQHLEVLERNHYKNELRLREIIRREFITDESICFAHPVEVYCISTRTSLYSFFNPDTHWNARLDSDYSDFAKRNMYFDNMRFLVFDILPPEHQNFRIDRIRFIAAVLIFISNQIPSSAMQTRRLYQLNVETDDTPLCTLVTSYDKKLEATYDQIENEIEKIYSDIPGEWTDKAVEELFINNKDILVQLDKDCNTNAIFAGTNYGLVSDFPVNECYKWQSDYKTSRKELAFIIKQQVRSVKKGVQQSRLICEVLKVKINKLSPFQVNDITDYTEKSEDEMIDAIPKSMANASRYAERLDKEADNIKKVLDTRMTRKTTISLMLFCLTLYLICFLPFLLSNSGTLKTISTAIVLILFMLGILGFIMYGSLYFLRTSIKNAVRKYNNAVHEIMDEIQTSMSDISKYLSALCNTRRGNAILNYIKMNLNEYTQSIRIRKKHQEDIRKKRAYLAEDYKEFFGDESCCDHLMVQTYDYDFDQKTEYAYPAPFLAGDSRRIEFISSGNYVIVPSSYVTHISIKVEGIYDK